MNNEKKAGIRFDPDLYINFVYHPDTNMVEVYKNGILISSGGGITPEELAEILEAYVTKEELSTALGDYVTSSDLTLALSNYVTNADLATALSDYVTTASLELILSNYITKTDFASDTVAGIVQLNSEDGIGAEDGVLFVEGRWGQDSETGGIYFSPSRELVRVGANSAVITEAKGIEFDISKSFGVITGSSITCKSASAGSTVYEVSNTYANRIICKQAENAYITLNEDSAKEGKFARVESVLIDGEPFEPDSSPNVSTASKRIKITVTESINPDEATTSIRIYPVVGGFSTAMVGQCVAQHSGRGASGIFGKMISSSANFSIIAGQRIYITEVSGLAIFGQDHIIKTSQGLFAGIGHDSSNASAGVSALGRYADLYDVSEDVKMLFAIGNGNSHVERSNAMALFDNGTIIAGSVVLDDDIEARIIKTLETYIGDKLVMKDVNGDNRQIVIDANGNITAPIYNS